MFLSRRPDRMAPGRWRRRAAAALTEMPTMFTTRACEIEQRGSRGCWSPERPAGASGRRRV